METHMRRYEGSGLTAIAYCHKHNIQQSTFYYWRRRLSQEKESGQIRFQEIKLTPGTGLPVIYIQFAHGATIRIEGEASVAYIRELAGC